MKLKLLFIICIIVYFKVDKNRFIGCYLIFDWLIFVICIRILVLKLGGGGGFSVFFFFK